MSRIRVVRNPGFQRELKADPEFEAAMTRTTEQAAEAITQAAPRHTGYFRRHIAVDGRRIRLRDPFWHLIEFGSINNPAYAPVRRGLRALGLRFTDRDRT